MEGGGSIITGCQHYSLRAQALNRCPFRRSWAASQHMVATQKGINWAVGGFPGLFALAVLVQQIMGGRLIFLHRTGSGRSALDGVGGQTKCAIVIAKTQGTTSRSPRDIYSSHIMYQHLDRRETRWSRAGAAWRMLAGVLSEPFRGNGWAQPRMPSISFPGLQFVVTCSNASPLCASLSRHQTIFDAVARRARYRPRGNLYRYAFEKSTSKKPTTLVRNVSPFSRSPKGHILERKKANPVLRHHTKCAPSPRMRGTSDADYRATRCAAQALLSVVELGPEKVAYAMVAFANQPDPRPSRKRHRDNMQPPSHS